MEMTGEYRIPAPRDKVWEALNDPEVLKDCIPGCESLEKISDTELKAIVTAKVGPVKAKFKGNVALTDLNPPASYTISGEGAGGVAGFAKGGADVTLTEDGADTVLAYKAKAQVGGKLAQIGSRLIDSTAKKMADDFFRTFTEKLGGSDIDEALIDRAEHAVDEVAHALEETAHVAEESLETAAGRGTFGGPVMWGWIALAALALALLFINT